MQANPLINTVLILLYIAFPFSTSCAMSLNPPLSKDTIAEPHTGMEFVHVSGGCFQMGDSANEGGKDELHDVDNRKYEQHWQAKIKDVFCSPLDCLQSTFPGIRVDFRLGIVTIYSLLPSAGEIYLRLVGTWS